MTPEELARLRERLLAIITGGTPMRQDLVAAGVNAVGGGRVLPLPRPPTKRGARTSKFVAGSRAATGSVGVERAPTETVRRNIPGEPGTGVQRIEHTSRPLTLAELEEMRRRGG